MQFWFHVAGISESARNLPFTSSTCTYLHCPFLPFLQRIYFFPFSFHEQILSKSKTFFSECRHNINALFYSFYNYLFWKLTKHLSVGKNAILRHLRFLQSKNYIYTKSHELKNELFFQQSTLHFLVYICY